ncbi:MAG: type II toxin-antitoxin system prevent-host-death family antitoxin [Thiovulaceae bacterium]|jgi:antitoxin YefM|nr:type II toxin-antitoxin system prevent-host-death family antitoxin [Sulfurimonadaceae bacterium]MDD3817924.1 type II toxin-antitoxin system prevent-host-death family antitoxin [Sulfurimonadaceae bacterium]
MHAITYTSLRANLAKTIDGIVNDHVPVLVTRQKGGNAILISEEDYRSFEETAYLMQSITNASRLNESIEQLRSGNGETKTLIEE